MKRMKTTDGRRVREPWIVWAALMAVVLLAVALCVSASGVTIEGLAEPEHVQGSSDLTLVLGEGDDMPASVTWQVWSPTKDVPASLHQDSPPWVWPAESLAAAGVVEDARVQAMMRDEDGEMIGKVSVPVALVAESDPGDEEAPEGPGSGGDSPDPDGDTARQALMEWALDRFGDATIEQYGDRLIVLVVIHPDEMTDDAPAEPDGVNINTASYEQLQTIGGIGPVKAGAIIAARDAPVYEPFDSWSDLQRRVVGIGPATLADIQADGAYLGVTVETTE